MEQISDEVLLAGLGTGNKIERDRLLRYLYTQHFPYIAAFITKNNGSDADAADIFQDAIIVFYEKVRLGDLSLNCAIRTYLYSVCRNLWMNRLRVKKRMVKIDELTNAIPIEPESLAIIQANERQEVIIKLMESLGPDCKKVLTLFYFDRLRMKEIAQQMSFANEQVAKNKKATCMKRIKALVLKAPVLKDILK